MSVLLKAYYVTGLTLVCQDERAEYNWPILLSYIVCMLAVDIVWQKSNSEINIREKLIKERNIRGETDAIYISSLKFSLIL